MIEEFQTYSDIITKIQPLDLVTFQNSNDIRNESYDSISSIGIIVTSDLLPDIPKLIKGRYYVLEFSTLGDNEDYRTRISELKKLVNSRKKCISVHPLKHNPWTQLRQPTHNRLYDWDFFASLQSQREFLKETLKLYGVTNYIPRNTYTVTCGQLIKSVLCQLCGCFRRSQNINRMVYHDSQTLNHETIEPCPDIVVLIFKDMGILPRNTYNYIITEHLLTSIFESPIYIIPDL